MLRHIDDLDGLAGGFGLFIGPDVAIDGQSADFGAKLPANDVGKHCGKAVAVILERLPHPEQGYRSCLGIKRLAKSYGVKRVEAACHRALALDVCSYRSIKSMLETGLDSQPVAQKQKDGPVINHRNIRGRGYYERGRRDEEEGKIWTESRSTRTDDPGGSSFRTGTENHGKE